MVQRTTGGNHEVFRLERRWMKKSFSIIGLGSLGGYVAAELADRQDTGRMVLMDFDRIARKNILNSIYLESQIGYPKVNVLARMIKRNNPDIYLYILDEKYYEGRSLLPKSDLVIDCRDIICDRGRNIDIRLYMSGRKLIIDCRKNVSYKRQGNGKYLENLSKKELRFAAMNFAMLDFDILQEFIRKQAVHEIYLDDQSDKGSLALAKIDNRVDQARDRIPGEEKLVRLPENIFEILEMNRRSDLKICVGDPTTPTAMTHVPRGHLTKPAEVVESLVCTLNKNQSLNFNYYIISPVHSKTGSYIELIPETGAA